MKFFKCLLQTLANKPSNDDFLLGVLLRHLFLKTKQIQNIHILRFGVMGQYISLTQKVKVVKLMMI